MSFLGGLKLSIFLFLVAVSLRHFMKNKTVLVFLIVDFSVVPCAPRKWEFVSQLREGKTHTENQLMCP